MELLLIIGSLICAYSISRIIHYYRDRDADKIRAAILKDTKNTDIRDIIPGQILKITGEVKPIENSEFDPERVGEEVLKRKERIGFKSKLKEIQRVIVETKSVDFIVDDGTGKVVVSLEGTNSDAKDNAPKIEITGGLDNEEYQEQYEYITCEISIRVGDIIEILGKCDYFSHHSGIYRQKQETVNENPEIRISVDEPPIYIHVRRRGANFAE